MKKILFIYTGGTIGMQVDSKSGALVPFSLTSLKADLPELSRLSVHVEVIALKRLIDSANASVKFWKEIGKTLFDHHANYDAFAVLHGTDTMTFSATACSFMLLGFQKPIIFTGSQLPISAPQTDAKENLLGALDFLISQVNRENGFKEVGVYFNNTLFRATRTTKIHSSAFNGFGSPNDTPLAKDSIIYPNRFLNKDIPLYYNSNFLDEGILVLNWHPLLGEEEFRGVLTPGLKILIIKSYGSGTLPTHSWLIDVLKSAIARGLIVINTTQCFQGGVDPGVYETSNILKEIGVLFVKDMTLEAIIIKAAWLYDGKISNLKFALAFFKDYCGEMG